MTSAASALKFSGILLQIVKALGKIIFFPLAALALGAACQFLLPEGLWRHEGSRVLDDGVSDRTNWKDATPKIATGAWLLVDAGEKPEFEAQHPEGAISLPAEAPTQELRRFAEAQGATKTVVVCGAGTEQREQLAARLRDEAGMLDIRVLEATAEENRP